MKNTYYKLLGILVLMIFCAVGVAFYMYNKPSVNVATSVPVYELSAKQLLSEFDTDEAKANTQYLENIIAVKGTVIEVAIEDQQGIITLEGDGMMANVICHVALTEVQNLSHLKQGDALTVKGICTGYLMDVVLVKCVIEN